MNTTSCENIFLEITLIGAIDYYSSLEEKIKELEKSVFENSNNKISISKIKNNTIPKIDYEKLKSDIGLIGEIIKTIENDINLEEVFAETNSILEKQFANCFFTNEEKELFKQEVLKKAKENCLDEGNRLYNKESNN